MAFLGKSLLLAKKTVSLETLNFKIPLLIYFSASWCPPCRAFTPILVDFYNSVNSKEKKCEVVFASLCRSDLDYAGYYDKMPWLSIPYSERKLVENLGMKYGVKTVPSLILVDEQGKALFNDCRREVENKKEKALETFKNYLSKPN